MDIGKDTSGSNVSIWFEHIHRHEFPVLNKHIKTDVCIIGAGITGLTTAYQLIQEGKKVVVIEDGRICSGETGRTSAHLTNVLDDRYMDIERVHGEEGAQFAAASHSAAIDFIESVVKKEQIDCDFLRVNGYLFPDKNEHFEILKKEAEAAGRAGIVGLELLNEPPENTFKMKGCLLFPNQAQFHPLKYLSHLAKIIEKKGGYIFENTHATNIKNQKKLSVQTQQGFTIDANQIVVATNVPINDRFLIHTKQEPNRTYMIGALIPENTVKQGLYWDTGHPYHYIRVVKGDFHFKQQPCDMLIIGGEDHRVAEPPVSYSDCFKKIENWAKTHFPQILSIDLHWSGQIIEPVDYLAFIGHNPLDNENVYIATGDSGNGLTHGTLAGILLSDLILKKENPWTALYDPTRKSIKTVNRYLKDNLASAATYLSYFSTSEISNLNNMSLDSGKVICRGLKKIAIYRDEKGKFHECSAVCPHLKSIVHWNSTEKSWDCPAHGSRFTPKGEVINGPANCELTAITLEEKNKN
jgi:glycine/D-amino acid oxidase-like deaminating enzyme/nitrite reductase/ring-hydroxylating ferredoxin subunit